MEKLTHKLLLSLFFFLIVPSLALSANTTAGISDIANVSGDRARAIADEAISGCAAYDDYEALVSKLKDMAGQAGVKNRDVLYYAVGKARFEQLKFLSEINDIESGRLYISVADKYYEEALDYLNKGILITASKDLTLDIDFLKILIFKERFQPQKAKESFDHMVSVLLKYSEDKKASLAELQKMSDKFNKAGFADYGVNIKVAFAAKADPNTAREIFNDIKKKADQYFAEGDFKKAVSWYGQYISLAEAHLASEDMASGVMEIGERYFSNNKYTEALYYYELYAQKYPDSSVIDYCRYRIALCHYYERNYKKTIALMEDFLATYQNSIWFDKAFETLCKLYYQYFPKEEAVKELQRLIDKYYRKNVGDFAEILIGLLDYGSKDYNRAVSRLKKIEGSSMYYYTAQTLIDDIKSVKRGAQPTFSLESGDVYRMWEPYKGINANLAPVKLSQYNLTQTEDGIPKLEVNSGDRVELTLEGLTDLDKFDEYQQDAEDESRLPKKINEETAKDLLSLQWRCQGGKFADDKEGGERTWLAPDEPGIYKVSVSVDDLGLVRLPGKGVKKDSAIESNLVIVVK